MLSSQAGQETYLKELPPWEELDYHKRPRRLRSLRLWFTLTAFLAGTAYAGWSLWPSHHQAHQAAPLAPAHASFNDNCGVCHTTAFRPLQRLVHGDSVRSVLNPACENCHRVPIHQEEQVREPDCAVCHREHLGKPILARVAPEHCTDCHKDLQRKDGNPVRCAQTINTFHGDHPEFRAVRPGMEDPGNLLFNHQFHLDLDLDALRQAGRPGLDSFKSKLECLNCHQPDGERRYMMPIRYDKHCAQCHPLSVQLAGQFEDPMAKQAAADFRRTPAPHKTPFEVQAVLRERLLQFAREYPVVLGPGKPADPSLALPDRANRPSSEKEWLWVKSQLHESEQLLFVQEQLSRSKKPLFDAGAGCAHCHVEKSRSATGMPAYHPTNIPQRWFPQSVFRHDSHQMLQCAACHGPALTTTKARDILVPGRQVCLECHHPDKGARTDCVECHAYHDRNRQRDLNGPFTIQRFLQRK